jgi:uncharacterized protein RhaS with RHS repeats
MSQVTGFFNQQLVNYVIADKDDDGTPNFYGYVRPDGSWYILKETVLAGADTYKYAKGTRAYEDNWTNRAGLTYAYFHNVFDSP